ncbi:MAG: signal peptidase I [Clostridiales bacterium]|nr:signal peptidase I [Clostridiales bacterium]
MKKVLRVLGDIFIVFFLVLSLSVMTLVLLSQKDDGIPNIFGYSPLTVQSDSMEPAMKKGDMIIIFKPEDLNDLKVGEVVTYYFLIGNQKAYNTHRIIEVEPHNEYNYYITRGDNSPAPDPDIISFSNVVGVWNGVRVPYLGTLMDLMKTQKGIFFVLILPLALMFVFQLIKFIGLLGESKKEEALEEATADLEAEKQKAIEEYIAQQKAKEEAEKAAALAAEELEREKQKAVEEYIAQQKAKEEAEEEAKKNLNEPPAAPAEEEIAEKAVADGVATEADEVETETDEEEPEADEVETETDDEKAEADDEEIETEEEVEAKEEIEAEEEATEADDEEVESDEEEAEEAEADDEEIETEEEETESDDEKAEADDEEVEIEEEEAESDDEEAEVNEDEETESDEEEAQED